MFRLGPYLFKFADRDAELEQVHALNYRTFVQEIPQHHDTGEGRLVDKFHHKNRYIIGVKNAQLVGMLCIHDQPPFSVAHRMPDPSLLARPDIKPLEVRLLAVEPCERSGPVPTGLVWQLHLHAREHGYSHLFISGVIDQLPLYHHIGFEPLGPPVGDGGTKFVPMWVAVPKIETTMGRLMELLRKRVKWGNDTQDNGTNTPQSAASKVGDLAPRVANSETATEGEPMQALLFRASPGAGFAAPGEALKQASLQAGASHLLAASSDLPIASYEIPEPVSLLPGPVAISPAVRAAFHAPLIYHRGEEFITLFERVRSRLSALAGGKQVAVLVGSGTLANDAVGATIAADPKRGSGLVLVNGEFGGRLLKQARRLGLAPCVLAWDWGKPWDFSAIEREFRTASPGSWVWGVHHETSTGVLNDMKQLVVLAKRYGVRVCLDCVSSLGAVPVDLSDVYLASSGSGKALGSYAGLGLVFADPAELAHIPAESITTYLDVPAALATSGPRFTVPSPLVTALDAALVAFDSPDAQAARFKHISKLSASLRTHLRELGLTPLAPDAHASPAIVTFAAPPSESAAAFVHRCREAGFLVAGHSGYLAERGYLQIAVMGDVTQQHLDTLFARLK
jgi:aspartate aminotransferase-like enzyme